MLRFLMLALTGATIALSPVASAPAMAGDRNSDLAKILGGLAVLGIVGKVIDNANDDDDDDDRAEARPRDHDRKFRRHGRKRHGWHRRADLPRRCLHRVETRHGPRRVFGKGCLRRNFDQVHRLPDRCETTVYAYGRDRGVYKARCLRRSGWTTARRH